MQSLKDDLFFSLTVTFLFFTIMRLGELLNLIGPKNPNLELLLAWIVFFPIMFALWRFLLKKRAENA